MILIIWYVSLPHMHPICSFYATSISSFVLGNFFFVSQQHHIISAKLLYAYTNGLWICHNYVLVHSLLHTHTVLFITHVLTFIYSALSILWTSLSVTSCRSSCQPIKRQNTTVVYVSPLHSTCWTTYKRRVMIHHIPHQSYRS